MADVTVPDSRPVLDVIAAALGTCDEWRDDYDEHQRRQAAAVLAACQGATVEQQAELTDGEVERGWDFYTPSAAGPVVRVIGPWRKKDPS